MSSALSVMSTSNSLDHIINSKKECSYSEKGCFESAKHSRLSAAFPSSMHAAPLREQREKVKRRSNEVERPFWHKTSPSKPLMQVKCLRQVSIASRLSGSSSSSSRSGVCTAGRAPATSERIPPWHTLLQILSQAEHQQQQQQRPSQRRACSPQGGPLYRQPAAFLLLQQQ
ncbi:hypothetical protein Efla_005952 [Eimeria flavescens]